jgi:hypothetical protein
VTSKRLDDERQLLAQAVKRVLYKEDISPERMRAVVEETTAATEGR